MPLNNSLLLKLRQDYPQFQFLVDKGFRWSPSAQAIFFPAGENFREAELLHELGHALLEHSGYDQDIELVQFERQAWEYAKNTLGPRYRLSIDQVMIDEAMDTYRDWLHSRSLCPSCRQSGLQTQTGTYQCLNCRCQWGANEARICLLRRYRV